MKLYDWLLKEDFADPLDIDALIIAARDGRKLGAMEGYISDGLHVIGTCGECKHLSESGKVCFKIMVKIEQPFGCIHFEARGEK